MRQSWLVRENAVFSKFVTFGRCIGSLCHDGAAFGRRREASPGGRRRLSGLSAPPPPPPLPLRREKSPKPGRKLRLRGEFPPNITHIIAAAGSLTLPWIQAAVHI